MSRRQIEEALYGWGDESSNSVEVHIFNLRRKIGRGLIEDRARRGYQVVPEQMSEGAAEWGQADTAAPPLTQSDVRRQSTAYARSS